MDVKTLAKVMNIPAARARKWAAVRPAPIT